VTDDPRPLADQVAELDRANRILTRRIRRMEDNVHQSEQFQDTTSALLSKLVRELEDERAKSQRLLLNVLPQRIIDRLGAGETVIADRHDDATVLLLDVVGFTRISSELAPAALVERLNGLFSRFDAICAETGVEKIKTVGDAYLVVGGLSGEDVDHVSGVAETALRMLDAVGPRDAEQEGRWKIRIGIARGPLIAGVIGSSKFAYDVWGDTVNLASRLETGAGPGEILVSAAVATALEGRAGFALASIGTVDLKGKGPTPVWSLSR
jgi:class 3 adenylate cyclase